MTENSSETTLPDSASDVSDVPPEAVDDHADSQPAAVPRNPAAWNAALENAVAAARCADELRGQDIVVLNLTKLTSIVDFFVIVTASSRRQMHAIADEVHRVLKQERGSQRLGAEGYRTEANWLLTDYGDVVVHVFTEDGRALYDLEQLWADAERIDWQAPQPDGSGGPQRSR